MPRFEPFAGLRYTTGQVSLDEVIAPPYDVISPDERERYAARSPWNVVHVDLPTDAGGADRYQVARELFGKWQADGVLAGEGRPAFYVYRTTHREDGVVRTSTGVIGGLELMAPGSGDVLPHEHTTPKARSDRLEMLRACRANLSAVWGLSLADGLTAACAVEAEPHAAAVDDAGVRHELWVVDDEQQVARIRAAVESAPVVIADGHHRYETADTYRLERREARGGAPGAYDLTMTWVVELAEDQLTVHAIHRLLAGLPRDLDLRVALADRFEVADGPALDAASTSPVTELMASAGSLCLVDQRGTALLRPRPGAFEGVADLDSARLDAALADLPDHGLTYQHGVEHVLDAVRGGTADAGILLRPATVAQIADFAHRRERMPPKTTFFAPKPATGLVFRPAPG